MTSAKRISIYGAASSVALALAAPAMAQEAGEPQGAPSDADESAIIVTAQRRAERLQDVPISITSLSSEKLENANVQKLGDIVKLTPALRFDYQSDFVQPTIRGVGNAVVTAGGGSNVGVYIDGFYSPNPLAADFQLLNLQSIQVLKGPQGTLFGRNTTGGAILVTTTDPTPETHGAVSASYGRFNTAGVEGYVSTGIAQDIAFDLSATYRRGDGYARNIIATGPRHPGSFENWSVRAGLKVDLSSSASLLFRYTHQQMDDATNEQLSTLEQGSASLAPRMIVNGQIVDFPAGTIATGYLDVAMKAQKERPTFLYKSDIFQLTGKFDLGFADLASYTQYRREDAKVISDLDATANDIIFQNVPVLDTTFSQELLLTSKPGGRLNWTAGLFYFHYVDQFSGPDGPIKAGANGDFNPILYQVQTHARTQSVAAYLDMTYEVADRLFLTAGARYSHDKFDQGTFQFLPFPTVVSPPLSGDSVTPRAVLRYEISNQSSVYASYSRGYKAGLVDVIAGGAVKPEKMDAFEVGYKFASPRFSASIAGWYYDYRDLQVSIYENGLSEVLNAASVRIYGVEGEFNYKVTPDFEISAGAAYVDAKNKSFPTAAEFRRCSTVAPIASCGPGLDAFQLFNIDAAGFALQRSPKFTANLNARYGFDLAGGRLTLSGSVFHTSKIYFDIANQFYQKAYDLVGLRAEWTDASDRFTVAAYGENVLGARYYSQILGQSTGIDKVWGAPETWGISLKYKFGR